MFILSIAIESSKQPWLVMLGCALTAPLINSGLISLSSMITVISIIASIVILSPFMLGLYFKRVCKVKTSIFVTKSLRWIVIILTGTFAFGFLLYFMYLSKSSPGLISITLVLVTVSDVLQVGLLILIYRQAERCERSMTEFHDFLLSYRQSPRSKILRKHRTTLSAVVEEESFAEYSAMGTS